MSTLRQTLVAALSLALLGPAAQAHRTWMLPSATVVGGKEPVVTVDAAASEDLFDFGGVPLKLDEVHVTAPDGSAVVVDNATVGRHRSSFEFRPLQRGTYRVSGTSEVLVAQYKLGGEAKRWRGTADAFSREVPPEATDVQVTRMQTRVETFVSHEQAASQPVRPQQQQGSGLELVPLTAPTDLSVDDRSRFQLLLDGRPAAGVTVTVLRGGNRYRYKLGEITLQTDAEGRFAVSWPEAGQYWLSAAVAPARGETAGGSPDKPMRRVSYSATFEVLPR